jgi:hypothetical protein
VIGLRQLDAVHYPGKDWYAKDKDKTAWRNIFISMSIYSEKEAMCKFLETKISQLFLLIATYVNLEIKSFAVCTYTGI